MLLRTLSLTKYTPTISKAHEAVERIKNHPTGYKAILFDVTRSFIESTHIIQTIRTLPGEKSTIIIGITGKPNQCTPQELKNLGFNVVVVKPIDCNILVRLVERLTDSAADAWLGVLAPTGKVDLY